MSRMLVKHSRHACLSSTVVTHACQAQLSRMLVCHDVIAQIITPPRMMVMDHIPSRCDQDQAAIHANAKMCMQMQQCTCKCNNVQGSLLVCLTTHYHHHLCQGSAVVSLCKHTCMPFNMPHCTSSPPPPAPGSAIVSLCKHTCMPFGMPHCTFSPPPPAPGSAVVSLCKHTCMPFGMPHCTFSPPPPAPGSAVVSLCRHTCMHSGMPHYTFSPPPPAPGSAVVPLSMGEGYAAFRDLGRMQMCYYTVSPPLTRGLWLCRRTR